MILRKHSLSFVRCWSSNWLFSGNWEEDFCISSFADVNMHDYIYVSWNTHINRSVINNNKESSNWSGNI